MRKFILGFAVVSAFTVASLPASAAYKHEKKMGFVAQVCAQIPGVCAKMQENQSMKTVASAESVPEIDAANAGLALALLGGIVAIRRERRSRQA